MNKTTSVQIKCRILERFDEIRENLNPKKYSTQDERRLFYAAGGSITRRLGIDDLKGKCFVRHVDDIPNLNAFKDQDQNNFYIVDTPHFQGKMQSQSVSAELYKNHFTATKAEFDDMTLAYQQDLQIPARPLRGMSLYAGGGGMDIGFHQSRAVKTEWAIEWDRAALSSYSKNFPLVKTFPCKADSFLESPDPSKPIPGDVDFIFGGKLPQSLYIADCKHRIFF